MTRRSTLAVSLALAGALFYAAVRGVDWARVLDIITGAQWRFVALGTGLTVCTQVLRSLRWRVLLNAEGSLDVVTVFCANMVGNLSNNFLPARAGEVVRSLLISNRSRLSKTYVLTTALSERLMDVMALVLASGLALWSVNPKPQWMAGAFRTMALLGLAGAIGAVALPRIARFWKSSALVERIMSQVVLGLRAFHDWRRFSQFSGLTVALWLSDACATVVGGWALGLHVSFPVAVLLLTGLGFASALPSTPGFVGIYQFIYVSILTMFGVSRDGALAFALVSQVMGYLVTLALGGPAFYLLQRPAEVAPAEGLRSLS